MSLDLQVDELKSALTDDAVREIHMLAARLREFGDIDDAAIQAVSEATGRPEDFVRLAIRSAPLKERQTLMDRIRGGFLAFSPEMRRVTMAGVLAAACGLFIAVGAASRDGSGFLGTLALSSVLGALWNSAVSKDVKTALLSGTVFGGAAFLVMTLFTFLLKLIPMVAINGPSSFFVLFWLAGGAFGGTLAHALFNANRAKLGLRDPLAERRALLEQLQDIQEKLKSDERFVTFLSVDIVGSTRLKAESDPLTAEYTFNEYQKYVQAVVERYGGNVHSTAGDGVTCVFESPQMAFAAGRALLAGLFEFNSYRNRLVRPIEVRAGVHTGSAHVAGQNLTNVSFAHVIDVAAHMQKAAEPGCLAVSETTANYLPGGLDAVGQERLDVHELRVAVWRPKVNLSAASLSLPDSAF